MQFTTITTFVYFFLSFSFLTVFATPLESRDVYTPQVLYPTKGTVWLVGQHHDVVWDTSNPPQHITNPTAKILLRKGGNTTSTILASNFSILLGRIEVVVPLVKNGDDYQVVCDSGDFSPMFSIKSN